MAKSATSQRGKPARRREEAALKEMRGVVKVFAGLLVVLTALLGVRYPILPEKLLPIYRVDSAQALSQVSLLSAAALIVAASMFLWSQGRTKRSSEQKRQSFSGLLRNTGAALIVIFAVGCIRDFWLTDRSTRIAGAITVGVPRERTDLYAREVVASLRNDGTSISDRYGLATEFLETKGIEPPPKEQLLHSVARPPLEEEIIATYVTATVSFKLGLFLMAGAIYARRNKQAAKQKRVLRADAAPSNLMQEAGSQAPFSNPDSSPSTNAALD